MKSKADRMVLALREEAEGLGRQKLMAAYFRAEPIYEPRLRPRGQTVIFQPQTSHLSEK